MVQKKTLEEFFGEQRRFGMLTVLQDAPYRDYGEYKQRMALVRCDCGATKEVQAKALKRGNIKSCGCMSGKGEKTIAEACGGLVHAHLTVIGETFGPKPKHGIAPRLAICLCKCGKEFIASPSAIKHKTSRGCGCRASTHGMSKTPEYGIWCGVKARCLNPNNAAYSDYGGRGITIHPDWINDFPAFFEHVGKRPNPELTLDRIDPNGNYEPGNMQRATLAVQANNKRRSIKIKVDGNSYPLTEFAADLGLRPHWLYHQIRMHGKTLPQIAKEMQNKLSKYIEKE